MSLPFSLSDNTYIEVLDSTRIHPETYEWARKMAVDALEYDEVNYVCFFHTVVTIVHVDMQPYCFK